MTRYCEWYDLTMPDASGERILACKRPGCGQRVPTDMPHDRVVAECESSVQEVELCGVGCHLSRILAWFQITEDSKCKCKSLASLMDKRGPGWCKRRSSRIMRWLREAASQRGLPFIELAAKAAVALAIRRAAKEKGIVEAEFMGLGDRLVEKLAWFDDGGLIRRLNHRGPAWAANKRNRVIQWITAVAAQKDVQLPPGAADAALDAALASAAQAAKPAPQRASQPAGQVSGPVDDPLVMYDVRGKETTGVKNLWRNCAAFLVCGGPSIKLLPYHKLAERGVLSLAVNNVAGMVPVRAMTFNDPAEKFHEGVLLDGSIMKFVPVARLTRTSHTRRRDEQGNFQLTGKNIPDYPNVWAFKRRGWYTPETFLTEDAATFGNDKAGNEKTGRPKIIFTMFMALRLLHYLGVKRVYMLGVDFHMDQAKGLSGNYAFDDDRYADVTDPEQHAREVAGVINGNNSHYRVANAMLTELRPIFEAAGFGVFNCNEWSRLTAFDYVPFEQALADCRNGVPEGELVLNGHYRKGVKK